MRIFDLPPQQQFMVLIGTFLLTAVLTGTVLLWTKIIRSKMKPETSILWPIGLSLMSISAFIGVGNAEPTEELILILIAHIFAFLVIRRRNSKVETLLD